LLLSEFGLVDTIASGNNVGCNKKYPFNISPYLGNFFDN
jgi:hypothetical protein